MIVEYINDDPRILVVPGGKALLASPGYLVHIRKGIDIAVDQDPLLYLLWKKEVVSSFHVIAHEVSHNDLFIASG